MPLITTPTYSDQADFLAYTGLVITPAEWQQFALLAEDILDTYVTIPDRTQEVAGRAFPTTMYEGDCGTTSDIPCDITKAHILITKNEYLKDQAGHSNDPTVIGGNSNLASEEWSSSSYKKSSGNSSGGGSASQDYEFVNVGLPALANRLLSKYRYGTLTFRI